MLCIHSFVLLLADEVVAAAGAASFSAGARGPSSSQKNGMSSLPDWVAHDNLGQDSVIGSEDDTAQVHPELLTKAFLQRAKEAGGSLQLAAVVGLSAEGGKVTAVRVRDSSSGEERELQADAVVFAMGE